MKRLIAKLIMPVVEIALYEIQQRRKKQAIGAGIEGLEVHLFMLLAAPDEVPQADAQVQQSDSVTE